MRIWLQSWGRSASSIPGSSRCSRMIPARCRRCSRKRTTVARTTAGRQRGSWSRPRPADHKSWPTVSSIAATPSASRSRYCCRKAGSSPRRRSMAMQLRIPPSGLLIRCATDEANTPKVASFSASSSRSCASRISPVTWWIRSMSRLKARPRLASSSWPCTVTLRDGNSDSPASMAAARSVIGRIKVRLNRAMSTRPQARATRPPPTTMAVVLRLAAVARASETAK